jgi:hypothetical protein
LIRQLRQRLVNLRQVELLELLLNGLPKERNIQIPVGGEGGVFRQQVQFLEGMGRLAKGRPERTVSLSGIMVTAVADAASIVGEKPWP